MELRDFLRVRCTQMLHFERDILKLIDRMIGETTSPRLLEIFRWHRKHVQGEAESLEQILETVGGPAEMAENPLSRGLDRLHKSLAEAHPPGQIADLHNLETGGVIADMKIALYRGLIDLAHQVGMRDVVQKLERNQADEERLRARLEEIRRPLVTELAAELHRKAA